MKNIYDRTRCQLACPTPEGCTKQRRCQLEVVGQRLTQRRRLKEALLSGDDRAWNALFDALDELKSN